jgi:hypothetical protein
MGAGYSTNMEQRIGYSDFEKCQKERDHCKNQHIGRWIILGWILEI